jgi:hypothetical protein
MGSVAAPGCGSTRPRVEHEDNVNNVNDEASLTAREARALPQIAVRRRCDFFWTKSLPGAKSKL